MAKLLYLGQEIVAGDDIYGGSDRLLSRVVPKSGVIVKLVWCPSLLNRFFFYHSSQMLTTLYIFDIADELTHLTSMRWHLQLALRQSLCG